MKQLRREYHDQLSALEDRLLVMGSNLVETLEDAMRCLVAADQELADRVIRRDDDIDEHYRTVQEGVMTTLALQAPVASELRQLGGFLHVNIHLERVGDLCVNIAKIVPHTAEFRDDPELVVQLQEMAQHAKRMITHAMDAFARRDLDMVRQLPRLDDPLDALNKGIFLRLARLAAADESRLDWAMWMVLVARYLERVGDHAVDIGEQVIYMVTGETVELASNSPTA